MAHDGAIDGIHDRLRIALKDAMRARNRTRMSTLRAALSVLDNATAVGVDVMPAAGAIEASATGLGAAEAGRRVLSEPEQQELILREADELAVSAAMFTDAEQAAAQRPEADALRGWVQQVELGPDGPHAATPVYQ